MNVRTWLQYHSQDALTLHKDEIHVWRVHLDQPPDTFQYLAVCRKSRLAATDLTIHVR